MAAAESIKALEYRVFEKLLKSKYKSADTRRRIMRKLLTELVEKERVKTTLARAKDLARVANRVSEIECNLFLNSFCAPPRSNLLLFHALYKLKLDL